MPPELDRRYPVVVRGEGVWIEDAAGKRYLDAMSGGSMAATLGVSPKTAGNHVEHIYSKIGASSRAAAGLFAMQHGLLS